MLDFAQVSLGAGAPLRCLRCHPDATHEPGYRSAAEIVADVESAATAWAPPPGPNVELGGPEPLGHPDLPVIVEGCVRAGVVRLRLRTDGLALASPVNAGGAVAAGVRHVSVVLLGGTPGMHDVLADRPGLLDAAVAGIRAFRAAAADQELAAAVQVLVPVCRHNVSDLPAAVARAVEAGADRVLLQADDPGIDLEAASGWVRAACDTGVVNGVWVEVDGLPFCRMGGYELHVADVVRERSGTHGPGCAACALAEVCGGGPADASGDTLASLAAPAGAERLAGRVRAARAGAPA